MIVVDTNVISELMRPQPHDAVLRWSQARAPQEVFTTAVTLAEIMYGIERLAAGRRREQVRVVAHEVFAMFSDRVLPFDAEAAVEWSLIVADRDRLGRPIDGFDAQIASICRSAGMVLATRNIGDFEHTGIDLVDPWQGVEPSR